MMGQFSCLPFSLPLLPMVHRNAGLTWLGYQTGRCLWGSLNSSLDDRWQGPSLCPQLRQQEGVKQKAPSQNKDSEQTDKMHGPFYPRLHRLMDWRWGRVYSSLYLLIRHISPLWFQTLSKWFPCGKFLWAEKDAFLMNLSSQKIRLDIRWIQFFLFVCFLFYWFSMTLPPFRMCECSSTLSRLWLTVFFKSGTCLD